jgi:hypothetical protein
MKSRTIKLPETVYEALHAAARAEGLTPADWLVAHLPHPAEEKGEIPTEADANGSDDWLEECIVTDPRAVGVQNERIDADLARAYAGHGTAPPTGARGS